MALRLGWLALPQELLEAVQERQRLFDYGCSRIEQHTLARFIADGAYDHHLRRMRIGYGSRRDALLGAIAEHLPTAEVGGIAAGLHATVRLPVKLDEPAATAAAALRGVALQFMSRNVMGPAQAQSTMLLSYARMPESSIRAGIRGIASALEAMPA